MAEFGDMIIEEKTPEQLHEEDLQRLKEFCPLHDTFARQMFRKNLPLAQLVLRIMAGIDDLVLTDEVTQYDVKRLAGARSVCLDVYGSDSAGRKYNLELERSEEGAIPERAEYHVTAMNSEHLRKGQDFRDLPETYILFVTEADRVGDGKAVHRFSYRDDETNEPMGGKSHILYVNAAYENDGDEIGRLMHDFRCKNADEMYFDLMAERTRYLKETEGGRTEMCQIMEDLRAESEARGVAKAAIRTAQNMLKLNLGTYEDIVKVSGLPLEKVKELAGVMAAQA